MESSTFSTLFVDKVKETKPGCWKYCLVWYLWFSRALYFDWKCLCIVILWRHERDIESFKALVEEARDFDLGNIEEIVNKKKNEFWKIIIWQHDYRFFRGNVVILIYCSFVGLLGLLGWLGWSQWWSLFRRKVEEE